MKALFNMDMITDDILLKVKTQSELDEMIYYLACIDAHIYKIADVDNENPF